MRLMTTLAAAAFGMTASVSAVAQDDTAAAGVSREEVLATATNMMDEPITYPTGAAKVTAELVTFEPNGHTALHTHPVPSFVYVLEGELEVRIEGQEPMRYTTGQAFMEPQNTSMHMQAFNVADGPTTLLVVYSGAEDGQNMVSVTQ
jgi:quercetin dioxygenase-like cupin family protein